MKKILSLIIALATFASMAPINIAQAAGVKQMILVTAYYSPKPGQSVYIRGSLAADIRLNGRGTNGADGTEVYPGMLAAPKSYPFGTRVSIPGLGVGEVHDRGGAILARKNYDRIDVWMGEGDEGLARAMHWGARLIEGTVYYNPHQVQPGLSFNHINSTMPANLRNRKMHNPKVFNKEISKASSKMDITKLQEALFSLGYFDAEVNGIYGSQTKEAVLMFQLNEGVVSNKTSAGAGNFGPQTQAKLKKVLEGYNSAVTREIKRLTQVRSSLDSGLGKKSNGESVERLQEMLWELGYYRGNMSGKYDVATIDAVYQFQLEHKVLKSEWDSGAGFYGKQTHTALVAAANTRITKMVELPMSKQVWVPAKKDLPQIAELTPATIQVSRQLQFDAKELNKKVVQELPSLLVNLDLYDQGIEVTKLQQVLASKGFLDASLATGYFGQKTKTALYGFQLEKGIVKTKTDTGAGRLGPKTRQILNQQA